MTGVQTCALPISTSSKEALADAKAFCDGLEKVSIIAPDLPGFIVNRLLLPFINQAALLVDAGVDPSSVDEAVKLGLRHPMGPLELADMIGLDICLEIIENLSGENVNGVGEMSATLVGLVTEGRLGKKSGQGFFEYGLDGVKKVQS